MEVFTTIISTMKQLKLGVYHRLIYHPTIDKMSGSLPELKKSFGIHLADQQVKTSSPTSTYSLRRRRNLRHTAYTHAPLLGWTVALVAAKRATHPIGDVLVAEVQWRGGAVHADFVDGDGSVAHLDDWLED